MKKKVKQIMSTALIIALTVTMFGNIRFCYVVKADTAKCGVDVDDLLEQAEDGMSDEEMEIIENDVEVLETFGITMLAKDINIVSEENSFIYEIKYAGQQNEVSNIEYTSEGVSFDCAQGDLKKTEMYIWIVVKLTLMMIMLKIIVNMYLKKMIHKDGFKKNVRMEKLVNTQRMEARKSVQILI